jgi:hypothetical protein
MLLFMLMLLFIKGGTWNLHRRWSRHLQLHVVAPRPEGEQRTGVCKFGMRDTISSTTDRYYTDSITFAVN